MAFTSSPSSGQRQGGGGAGATTQPHNSKGYYAEMVLAASNYENDETDGTAKLSFGSARVAAGSRHHNNSPPSPPTLAMNLQKVNTISTTQNGAHSLSAFQQQKGTMYSHSGSTTVAPKQSDDENNQSHSVNAPASHTNVNKQQHEQQQQLHNASNTSTTLLNMGGVSTKRAPSPIMAMERRDSSTVVGVGVYGSAAANGNGSNNTSTMSASTSSSVSPSVGNGRCGAPRYRHNPYVSSEPNTPTMKAVEASAYHPPLGVPSVAFLGGSSVSSGHGQSNIANLMLQQQHHQQQSPQLHGGFYHHARNASNTSTDASSTHSHHFDAVAGAVSLGTTQQQQQRPLGASDFSSNGRLMRAAAVATASETCAEGNVPPVQAVLLRVTTATTEKRGGYSSSNINSSAVTNSATIITSNTVNGSGASGGLYSHSHATPQHAHAPPSSTNQHQHHHHRLSAFGTSPVYDSSSTSTCNTSVYSSSGAASSLTSPVPAISNHSHGGPNAAAAAFVGPHHHQHTGGLDIHSLGVIEQFNASLGNLCEYACTVNGRHVLVAVMRQQNDRLQLVYDEVGPNIGVLALDAQACHVVRSLLDYTAPEQNEQMVECLTEENVIEMAIQSQQSRRILQCIFERLKSTALDGVVRVIAREASTLATTQQGCITVMRVVEHGLPHQREIIFKAIMPFLAKLTMDPYGNYVVQAMLTHANKDSVGGAVTEAFRGHWLPLCCNKFASNVMEKVVQTMAQARETLLKELIFSDESGLRTLVNDGYGNFVIQSVIESAGSPAEVAALAERIRPILAGSQYMHRIEARLKGVSLSSNPTMTHHHATNTKSGSVGHHQHSHGHGQHGNAQGSSHYYHRNDGQRGNGDGKHYSFNNSNSSVHTDNSSSQKAPRHQGGGRCVHNDNGGQHVGQKGYHHQGSSSNDSDPNHSTQYIDPSSRTTTGRRAVMANSTSQCTTNNSQQCGNNPTGTANTGVSGSPSSSSYLHHQNQMAGGYSTSQPSQKANPSTSQQQRRAPPHTQTKSSQ